MIPIHPLAEHFPLLQGKEFSDLVESIKRDGQLDPITLHEGMILDGRNRYRACVEADIEPRTQPLADGLDPIEFVLSKNLHRRHLSLSERVLAVAKYATIKNGQHKPGPGTQHVMTNAEAANFAGCSEATIKRAKVVLANGTANEIADVKNGKRAIKPTAKKIRAEGRTAKKNKPRGRAGYRIRVPPEFPKLSDAVRVGIERERKGLRAEALKRSGLKSQTYLAARDIVLLADRDDLSEHDAQIAQRALREMDDTRTIRDPLRLIKPIAEKVWGQKGNRFKSDKSRLETFCNCVSFVVTGCTATSELSIPVVGQQQRNELITSLGEAINALRNLQMRIKGE